MLIVESEKLKYIQTVCLFFWVCRCSILLSRAGLNKETRSCSQLQNKQITDGGEASGGKKEKRFKNAVTFNQQWYSKVID